MSADETPKNWGTIFMGTDREVNLDQLSAVAPNRSGYWRRDQEETYLDRVQQRAKDQAHTILSEAGKTKTALLEEARDEIERMREEAAQQAEALLAEHLDLKAESERLHAEAARLNEEARLLHAGAEETGHAEGYAAGLAQAQADLEHFRAVMGEAVGSVLSAVHAQCDRIFEVWKEDLCALLLACVEKGTGFVLDADRKLLLKRLFLDSVKLFEARSSVLVRVRADDEAVVADMFAAAKERIPGLDAWHVQGDPELAPGDLVLEAAHSRVESRVEERRSVVDEALRHVLLPAVPEEESGREEVARVAEGALARMFDLVPKQPQVPDLPHDAAEADAAETPPSEAEVAPADDDAPPALEHAGPGEADAAEDTAAEALNPEARLEAPAPEAQDADDDALPALEADVGRNPDNLETADAADAVDAVLAEGGFLPTEGELDERS